MLGTVGDFLRKYFRIFCLFIEIFGDFIGADSNRAQLSEISSDFDGIKTDRKLSLSFFDRFLFRQNPMRSRKVTRKSNTSDFRGKIQSEILEKNAQFFFYQNTSSKIKLV